MADCIIVQESSDVPSDWSGLIFVIDEELSSLDDEDVYAALRSLYNYYPDSNSTVPLYRILWSHLAASEPGMGALLDLVPLANHFASWLSDSNVGSVCIKKDVKPKYLPMIVDVCDECGCSVRVEKSCTFKNRIYNSLSWIFDFLTGVCAVLVTQMISLVLPNERINSKPIAIFPYPGRPDSLLPIARELDNCSECFSPALGSSYYRPKEFDASTPSRKFQDFVTLSIIYREIQTVIDVLTPRTRRSLRQRITKHLESEFGLSLPRTVRSATHRVLGQDVRSLLNFVWANEYFKTNKPSAVLVGGPHAREFAILEAAIQNRIQTYYVHHSVVTGSEFLPPTETKYFVPSQVGKQHIRTIYRGTPLPTLTVSGRPYFDARYNDDYGLEGRQMNSEGDFTVLVATQPFRNTARKELVTAVEDACCASSLVENIRLKIHPDESRDFYRRLINECLQDTSSVTITDNDLTTSISDASIVVTINSNVGVESMIHGTPLVCYNKWYPSIQNKAYAQSPEVPLFKHKGELTDFVGSSTKESIDALAEAQQKFVHEQFLRSNKAAATIADQIVQEMNCQA